VYNCVSLEKGLDFHPAAEAAPYVSSAEHDRILGALKPYKDECREIGFEEGTEKFGECILELSR
jgi:hypothetical protein